jgi:hypothetical protein
MPMIAKLIKFPPDLLAEIQAVADSRAAATGEPINVSAVVRYLLRLGLNDRAERMAWCSTPVENHTSPRQPE